MDIFHILPLLENENSIMCYLIIHQKDSSQTESFKLTEDEIKRFLHSQSILLSITEMEEIYDQVIESFWDYNNKVNYWSMRSILKPIGNYELDHEITSSLNRLSFNVLNLGKLFLDMHYNESKNSCFSYKITESLSSKEKIKTHRDKIYDENIKYLIGCKLRSKSQHRILPVQSFSSVINNQKVKDKVQILFEIPYNYKKLKRLGIPQDRIDKDSTYDLTEILSGYIFAISQKQELNRELTLNNLEEAKKSILNLTDRYSQGKYKKSDCYYVVDCNDGQKYNANLDWTTLIDYLRKKHPSPIDYSKMFYDEL